MTTKTQRERRTKDQAIAKRLLEREQRIQAHKRVQLRTYWSETLKRRVTIPED